MVDGLQLGLPFPGQQLLRLCRERDLAPGPWTLCLAL